MTMKTLKWYIGMAVCCMCCLTACQDNDKTDVDVNGTPEQEEEVKKDEPQHPAPPQETNTRKEITLTESEQGVAALGADFAFRLLQAVETSLSPAQRGQIVLSPLSAEIALAMLANGAVGDTQREIVDALGYAGQSMADVDSYHQKLAQNLTGLDDRAEMNLANSLWLHPDFAVKERYTQLLGDCYAADIRRLDFTAPDAVATINAWCEEKTKGLIKNFLQELNADGGLLLLNALYFNGMWKMAFDEKATERGFFTNEEGSRTAVELMRMTCSLRYAQTELYEAACLPYGNDSFRMTLLLPREGVSVSHCLASLDRQSWAALQAKLGSVNAIADVKLPKFQIAGQRQDLQEALQAMGIRKAFADADLSGISDRMGAVSKVAQAVSLRTDENGTEAASVTGIEMDGAADGDSATSTVIPFHVDRPFLFLITERSTGTVLFIGRMGAMA